MKGKYTVGSNWAQFTTNRPLIHQIKWRIQIRILIRHFRMNLLIRRDILLLDRIRPLWLIAISLPLIITTQNLQVFFVITDYLFHTIFTHIFTIHRLLHTYTSAGFILIHTRFFFHSRFNTIHSCRIWVSQCLLCILFLISSTPQKVEKIEKSFTTHRENRHFAPNNLPSIYCSRSTSSSSSSSSSSFLCSLG